MTALSVFLLVLIMGSLWRLASYHLVSSQNPTVAHVGKAMGFQY